MGKIVITGASSEIGCAIVEKVSGLNKEMLLHCNNNISNLEKWRDNSEIVVADFSNREALEVFIKRLSEVDILINAAAYTYTDLLSQTDDKEINKMIDVNIFALTAICKRVIPEMCVRRSGIIINISSVTASKVYRGHAVYAATKAYIETFSKAIVAEYGKKGIKCNCIAPGGIYCGSLKGVANICPEKIKEINAMNKLGKPEDVAEVVSFLCSESSNYINGAVIHVDGGHWFGV